MSGQAEVCQDVVGARSVVFGSGCGEELLVPCVAAESCWSLVFDVVVMICLRVVVKVTSCCWRLSGLLYGESCLHSWYRAPPHCLERMSIPSREMPFQLLVLGSPSAAVEKLYVLITGPRLL